MCAPPTRLRGSSNDCTGITVPLRRIRREAVREHCRERAVCKLGADVSVVCGLLEEMGVGVEGNAGARVAKDAAYLGDVEADVDDQVACKGVVQVMEAQTPAAGLGEAAVSDGARKREPGCVSVQQRASRSGREHVVARLGETGAALVLAHLSSSKL